MKGTDHMIKQLQLASIDRVQEIVALQKASYAIEAELIGFDGIPPLHDTADRVRNAGETFWGYFYEGRLSGLISYKISGDTLDIHRVAVHPELFRKGIARKLVAHVLQLDSGTDRVIVSTGYENKPAVNLYLSMGFKQIDKKEIVKDLFIACFEYIR